MSLLEAADTVAHFLDWYGAIPRWLLNWICDKHDASITGPDDG